MKLLKIILLSYLLSACSSTTLIRDPASIGLENCFDAISSFDVTNTRGLGTIGSQKLSPGWRLEESDWVRLNQGQRNTLHTLRPDQRLWNIENLNRVNLPVPVATLKDQKKFSKIHEVKLLDVADIDGNPVRPLFKVDGVMKEVETNYGQNVRMMLAKLPSGEFLFPKELEQFEEAAMLADEFFRKNFSDYDDYHVYVSIHQGKVVKENTQARLGKSVGDDIVQGKRTGAHVDGYQVPEHIEDTTIDHTVMVSDNVPTEFFNHPFDIENIGYSEALQKFDDLADMRKVVYAQPYVLALIDAYGVHRMGIATEDGERSFIKFKLSKKVFNQEGNTLNPLIDYKKLKEDATSGLQNPLWKRWTSKDVNLSEGRGNVE
ncbi:hypothetical protein [Bacteriovorax sp. Seq25_V]|uniref:hypothetical protein n=1 Tax=Bacteriovorax sp. Seq25_V TaxID=1201288 RepID=UPI00038A3C24|nr:hypothetical protein [Bacteriovorax sp. Seq25_V]EQC45650.1 putative lipoprotein [Bacteriovorax sp. Seq25_V]